MTVRDPEWSVLVTARQAEAEPGVSDEQARRLLDALGPTDAWVQYPPASGREHGFETRWWQRGRDAAAVAAEATARYREAVGELGLDVEIVLVHVASVEDRLSEAVIGLHELTDPATGMTSWNAMVRAVCPDTDGSLVRADLESLLELLPGGGSSGFARDRLVEVRFWVDATGAVDATERAAELFSEAMATLGRPGWTVVRVHTVSVAEAQRTAYHGVERRLRDSSADPAPVAVRA